MNLFWTLMSAISNATGNFMTRCPKCAGKMKRMEMHEQAYSQRSRFAATSRPTSTFNTELGRRALLQIRVVPVYDVCTECGYRVRRRDDKIG
jgi:uncharacterized protein with PIN domain